MVTLGWSLAALVSGASVSPLGRYGEICITIRLVLLFVLAGGAPPLALRRADKEDAVRVAGRATP